MKKIAKKAFSLILCAVILVACSASAFADGNDKTISLAFTDAPTLTIGDMTIYHPSYAAMMAFKGSFEKSTGNEYTVELYANGVLGDAASTLEQILAGTVGGSTPADGTFSAFAPELGVFSIPYIFSSPTVAYDVLDGPFGQEMFERIAKETGFRIVAVYDNGGYRNFTNSKREIRSAADMQGLNIRVMDSPVYLELVRSMGASATPIAFLELYSALQTGVVDGQENSSVTTLGGHLDEVQPYCTLDGHLLGFAFLTISEEWYQSLDEATRAKVDMAGREATLAARGTCRYAEALATQTLTQKGVQVYAPTAEEMETFKVSQAPVIEYLKGNLANPGLVDELFAAIEAAETGAGSAAVVATEAAAAAPAAPAAAPEAPAAAPAASSSNGLVIAGVAVLAVVVIFVLSRKKKAE